MPGGNGSLIRLLRGGSGKSAGIAARCVMSRLGELRQEAEWRRCVRSEKYFLEHYWYIAHPAEGRIPVQVAEGPGGGFGALGGASLFVVVEGPSDWLDDSGGCSPVLVGVFSP